MPDSVLDAGKKISEPPDVEKPGGRIRPGRLEQIGGRDRAAQHVVDEVGRHRHLASGFDLAWMAALDQARNDGRQAERALHQVLLSASQASRSSPSMSSSKSSARSTAGHRR